MALRMVENFLIATMRATFYAAPASPGDDKIHQQSGFTAVADLFPATLTAITLSRIPSMRFNINVDNQPPGWLTILIHYRA